MKKICIIVGTIITEQNLSRFGVDIFCKIYDIYIIDCKGALSRKGSDNLVTRNKKIKGIFTADNINSIFLLIKSISPEYVFDFSASEKLNFYIPKICNKIGTTSVIKIAGMIPSPTISTRVINFLTGRYKQNKFDPKYYLNKIISTIFISFNKYEHDILLVAGSVAMNSNTKAKGKFIQIASDDYHIAKIKNKGYQYKKNYVVFIDDCITHADDWKLLNLKSPVDPTHYYQVLNNFLNNISKEYNVDVLIAGHPNSKKIPNFKNNFNYNIIFDETASLIKNCDFVITHASTAISFAVIHQKPIQFITTIDLEKTFYRSFIYCFANYFNQNVLNIEIENKNKISPLKKDDLSYERYYSDYILCKGFEENEYWGNFLKYINKNKLLC